MLIIKLQNHLDKRPEVHLPYIKTFTRNEVWELVERPNVTEPPK
jgi:hypothetical protein